MGNTKSPDSKSLNIQIFKGKNVNSLLEDIYDTINNEHNDIQHLFEKITEVLTGDDADEGMLAFAGSALSELLDVSIKNNEQYIKLAEVVQKFLSLDIKRDRLNNTDEDTAGSFVLSDEDKKHLLNIRKQVSSIEDETKKIQNKVDGRTLN